ncbi:MAG: UDP-glucose 4-epimerase GalE [Elusimicrobia bacterium]|nr:UDP-glucose 4-epimerase GalE [Elusimicrobiota bacterium]
MILIVGGAGYIGSHTNKYLSLKGEKTIVLDNLVYGHKEFVKWGNFYFGDLADKLFLKKIFAENKIKAVMHFSAYAYVGESVKDPAKYYQNNVVNAINLLEAMRESKVNNFIFSSTCATYGNPVEIPITEEHPQNPVNPYGRTKLMIEQVLKDYSAAYGIKYVNLRYFNAAGADPDAEIGEWHNPETHLIPLAIDAALGKRDSLTVFGTDYPTKDGTCVRDYIHVNDLAQAHCLALNYLLDGGESDSFNLGNGNGFSVKEIISVVEKVSGRKIKVIEGARREGDPAVLIGSSDKIKSKLDWHPKFDDINTIINTAYKYRCQAPF